MNMRALKTLGFLLAVEQASAYVAAVIELTSISLDRNNLQDARKDMRKKHRDDEEMDS